MKDLTNQIELKRQLGSVFRKVGRCLIWMMCLTSVVPIALSTLWFFGKVQSLQTLNAIVGSAGVVIVFYLLAQLCFNTEAKLLDEAYELEHSRDGLSS